MGDRDQELKVSIEDGEIVIRIGVDALAWAIEHNDDLETYDEKSGEYLHPTVTDADELANEVLSELEHEEEDGTTPVMMLFDAAVESALENGSLSILMPGDE